ncbi:hypothetical protein [Nonlabens ponticola]|uniref:Lipocalin-like domain-containing protein n=1 Tax=Nonlabens ponticola TaxID=2496866 RepID=A0A3S9MZ71_9FLAO|nr:hypothetical protein [Nonlabens ponticola]AZQ44392.1 hypothetical protein EJ995_09115 [Nonlabens ponticola]
MKYTVLFTLLICFTACKTDKTADLVEVIDCTDVKEGKFAYNDPIYGDWIIERKGDKNIETSPDTDLKIYSDIKWITDCEYELHVQDVGNSDNMAVVSSTIRILITEVTENGYKCIAYTNEGPQELEMIRVDG